MCNSVAHASDRPYGYVFVTTKAIPELIRTPTLLSPLLNPPYSDTYAQPTYVLLQNGLNVEANLYDAIKKLGKGEPKIVGTAVYIGVNLIGDNTVEHGDFVRIELIYCGINKLTRQTGPVVTWYLQTELHHYNKYTLRRSDSHGGP